PFVLHAGNLYLHRYFSYETEIIERIRDSLKEDKQLRLDRMSELEKHQTMIRQLFSKHTVDANLGMEENINWQLIAALTSLLNNFSIITGGPGTGKTTTVAKLLAILFATNPNLRVALAAPTGKAAARMMESLKNAKSQLDIDENIQQSFEQMEASTLHRLLGYVKNSPYFRHNADNPLHYDVIIVDESSMIGVALMAKLLTAVKSDARIMLLGDKDQLASVEAGSIFGDICITQADCMNRVSQEMATWMQKFDNPESFIQKPFIANGENDNILQEHIIELKRSHRFKSNEGIGQFSKAVIHGNLSEDLIQAQAPQKGEYVQVCEDYQSPEQHQLMDYFTDYIQETSIAEALNKLNHVRFLCAVRNGKYGVKSYNTLIESYLQKKGLIRPIGEFYEHQPIMITQNDYNLGLFNGDIGIIRKDANGALKAWFEDAEKGVRPVNPAYIKSCETVYAMTIHKSQGSEFRHVGMVLPEDENSPILTRELIYTGITRAKKSVVIFTSKATLLAGVAKQVERASGITQRFMNKSL
ncbi:MAG: exodeoxyribonuclease V subunit alpha, partial [Salinivirgaceae bacterium]